MENHLIKRFKVTTEKGHVGYLSKKSSGFSFTWSIRYLSSERFPSTKKDDTRLRGLFESPPIQDKCHNCVWSLELTGRHSEDFRPHGYFVGLSLRLVKANDGQLLGKRVTYRFSIFDQRSKEVNVQEGVGNLHKHGAKLHMPHFVQQNALFDKFLGLMPNDTLTIGCRVTVDAVDRDSEAYRIGYEDVAIEYQDEVCRDLGTAFLSGDYSDVTLVVEGKEIAAHKVVLASRSPVFRAMFQCDMRERQESKVVIPDLELDVVNEMLHFLYTGQARNLASLAYELMHAANRYSIASLATECERYLGCAVSLDNYVEINDIAELYGLDDLKTKVYAFVMSNEKEVVKSPKFTSFSTSYPNLADLVKSSRS